MCFWGSDYLAIPLIVLFWVNDRLLLTYVQLGDFGGLEKLILLCVGAILWVFLELIGLSIGNVGVIGWCGNHWCIQIIDKSNRTNTNMKLSQFSGVFFSNFPIHRIRFYFSLFLWNVCLLYTRKLPHPSPLKHYKKNVF